VAGRDGSVTVLRQILHITDVHFGRHHQPDRAAGLLELAAQRRPDLVAFSGDVTKRAKRREFEQGRRFVDALAAPTVVVPGNHDVPMYRVWERALRPYGAYRRHFAPDLEPVFRDDELLVIGVNTAWGWTIDGGRVWPRRARRLERQLVEGKGSRFAIVLLHHQMIPVPGYGSPKVMRNAMGTAQALVRGGADLVLSGHVHLSYLGSSEELGESAPGGLPVLFSGTASSSRGRGPEKGRNSCHWIEVDVQSITIERLEWDSQVGGFIGGQVRRLDRRSTD
jgi:3',5'-cyclic AMP phosphodiesterase CpdA